jgi:molecular chaperone DnaJ
MKKNFYKVLGINQKASPEKIRRAYREAAKRYHPDVSQRNEEKFREVQEAYETLSDPSKKAFYDRQISERRPSIPSPQSYDSYPLRSTLSSLVDEIDQFFGRFEEFWTEGGPGFSDKRDQRHHNLFVEITLTPLEARRGCEIPLRVPFWQICTRCRGTGFVGGLICGLCRGRGEQRLEKKIKVSIPPGMRSGMEMRIPLKDPELKGVNLIATVKTLPSPARERRHWNDEA